MDNGITYGDGDTVTVEVNGQSVFLDFAGTLGGINGPAADAIISDVRAVLSVVARKVHEIETELMAPRS